MGAYFSDPGRRQPPASHDNVADYGPITVLAALTCIRTQLAALDIAKACAMSDFHIAGLSGMRALRNSCYVDLAMVRSILEGHVGIVLRGTEEGAFLAPCVVQAYLGQQLPLHYFS